MGVAEGEVGQWAHPKTIFSNAGTHCAIKVGPKGGIHIAAYDTGAGDLRYAYLSNYKNDNGYTEAKAVTVDAYDLTGEFISIDVGTNSSGKEIPYISYYSRSVRENKVAYLTENAKYTDNGANPENESYTGKWEVAIIPSNSKILEDRVNIGLWKTNGVISNSTTDKSSSSQTSGICYGNGTANPIIGYAISGTLSGALETAQMK